MPKYDVFLSHHSADKPAVEKLAQRLEDEVRLVPFLDKWHLVPGEPWQEALEEALDQSGACAVFIGPGGISPWENEEMRSAIEQRVARRDFRVIPVLLPGAERGERGRLPAFLTRTTWVEFRDRLDDAETFRRLVAGIKGQPPGRSPDGAIYEGKCPYRGLQVFEEEHARFFFGREAATEWLIHDLRTSSFLTVIGPSGSGKSSLVRAGLIPALRRGDLPGSDNWPLRLFRPGHRPLENLALAITPLMGPAGDPAASLRLMDALRDDPRQLHLTAQLALSEASSDRKIVLVVDQFEEIFTLCRDETQRNALIGNLLYASAIENGRIVVILTMRADFYGKCAAYPDLAARITDHQMLVSPMVEEELRQAIERPAQLVGLEFESGLVDTLLRDVQAEPGALPLLQHTLLELWERRQGHRLTFAAYRKIDGVQGAIAHRAESIYAGFDPSRRAITRRIMLRLTQPGEGTEDTRRQTTLAELLPAEGEVAEIEAVVQELANVRLLTTGKDERDEETVDVAHEALIRGWPRLQSWIDEDRAGLRTHRHLTEAAQEWERYDRNESFLYQGARLAEAEEWAELYAADLSLLEREFLEASLARQKKREQQRRLLLAGAVAAAVVMAVLAGISYLLFQNAQEAAAVAVTAEARAVAAADALEEQNAKAQAELRFYQSTDPAERLTELYNLFNRGEAASRARARFLFFSLPKIDQLALLQVREQPEELAAVGRALLPNLADINGIYYTDEKYLEPLLDSVTEADLQAELDSWLAAREAAKTEDYKTALARYDNLLAGNPQNPALYYERARVRAKLGQASEALADLSQAMELAQAAEYESSGVLPVGPEFATTGQMTKAVARLIFVSPDLAAEYEANSAAYRDLPAVKMPTVITDAHGVPMVRVPAGKFKMGSNAGGPDEQPVHEVYLDEFYIDRYEVTNARYAECVATGACDTPECPEIYGDSNKAKHPIVCVFWDQARSYCEWRGGSLPTEAQWEKAARGGDERTYPWGEEIAGHLARYYNPDREETTAPVGHYPEGISPYGAYDMAGNVWEWVADSYDGDYYKNSPAINPPGPDDEQNISSKVLRGGSWDDLTSVARASTRRFDPINRDDYVGFRCVRSAP